MTSLRKRSPKRFKGKKYSSYFLQSHFADLITTSSLQANVKNKYKNKVICSPNKKVSPNLSLIYTQFFRINKLKIDSKKDSEYMSIVKNLIYTCF